MSISDGKKPDRLRKRRLAVRPWGSKVSVIEDREPSPNPTRPSRGQLVFRPDGVYLTGCDVPVWRLEMARRAGTTPATLINLFPGLTPRGLDRAFAYARRNRAAIDRLIEAIGLERVPPEPEQDDDADFERELVEMLDQNADLFRRLAR